MEEKDYREKPLAATVLAQELTEIYEQFSERIADLVRYKEAVYGISRISYYKRTEE